MMAARFSIAAAALALVFFKKLRALTWKKFFHGALTGAFLFLGYAFQTVGCAYTTAGKNAFLTTLYVILIPFFAWPVFRKRPKFVALVAAVIALCGIGMLALKKSDGIFTMNIGDALTLVCGIFYALHIVFTSRYNKNESDFRALLRRSLSAGTNAISARFSWRFVLGNFQHACGLCLAKRLP